MAQGQGALPGGPPDAPPLASEQGLPFADVARGAAPGLLAALVAALFALGDRGGAGPGAAPALAAALPCAAPGAGVGSCLVAAHAAAAVAFGVALLLSLTAMGWAAGAKRQAALVVSFINAVTLVCYVAYAIDAVPKIAAPGGGTVNMLRFVEWVLTTPGLIVLLSGPLGRYVSAEARGVVVTAFVADVLMLILGAAERYYNFVWPTGTALLAASCAAFIVAMRSISRLFALVDASLVSASDRAYLRSVERITHLVWSLFPATRLLNYYGVLSDDMEEMTYIVLDLGSKMAYSTSLMIVNFTVIDSVLESRLAKYADAVQIAQSNQEDVAMLNTLSDARLKEAHAWRVRREAAMLQEGMPAERVAVFLDAALQEYVALASGDISAYLQPSFTG